jgi:hypothetical protein
VVALCCVVVALCCVVVALCCVVVALCCVLVAFKLHYNPDMCPRHTGHYCPRHTLETTAILKIQLSNKLANVSLP